MTEDWPAAAEARKSSRRCRNSCSIPVPMIASRALPASLSEVATDGSLTAARAPVTDGPLTSWVHWAISASFACEAVSAAAACCWACCAAASPATAACCARVAVPAASVAVPTAAWSIRVWIMFCCSSATRLAASEGSAAWDSAIRKAALPAGPPPGSRWPWPSAAWAVARSVFACVTVA